MFYFQEETADLKIALTISPAKLGDITFEVGLTDVSNGFGVGNASEVRLILSMREMEMGSPQLELKPSNPAKGRYLAQGSVLSMKGDWDATILIKREGKDDLRVPVKFKIN